MKKLQASLVAAAMVLPGLAMAESQSVSPAAAPTSTASAKVDFTVVIPAVLYLRVGTGSGIAAANNATINSLVFNVPATGIGDGTSVVATAPTDGDLGAGGVSVRVFSNVGTNVELNSNVTGRLTSVAGDTIPWTDINVAVAADPAPIVGWTNTGIAHPAFNTTVAGGDGTATTLTAVGKVVRQQGRWTFTYGNNTVYPAGTYGTSARNGRVTYTATQL